MERSWEYIQNFHFLVLQLSGYLLGGVCVPCTYRMPVGAIVGDSSLCCVTVECVMSIKKIDSNYFPLFVGTLRIASISKTEDHTTLCILKAFNTVVLPTKLSVTDTHACTHARTHTRTAALDCD